MCIVITKRMDGDIEAVDVLIDGCAYCVEVHAQDIYWRTTRERKARLIAGRVAAQVYADVLREAARE